MVSELQFELMNFDCNLALFRSYGGYLSLMGLVQYPDLFKVAISGAPGKLIMNHRDFH